jgi:hypothetical protein
MRIWNYIKENLFKNKIASSFSLNSHQLYLIKNRSNKLKSIKSNKINIINRTIIINMFQIQIYRIKLKLLHKHMLK